MSCGRVVCSSCLRECDQGRPKDVAREWHHSNDGSTICDGAEARYPTIEDKVRCEAKMSDGSRCQRPGVKWTPTRERWQTIWTCESAHRSPIYAGVRVGRNDPCPCDSGRKFKKCCNMET